MNLHNCAEVVRAMDTLARSLNDEDIFMTWLSFGVADGDIKENTSDEDLEYYCEDNVFAGTMNLFLNLMSMAYKDGGIQCDGIVSERKEG